MIKHLFASYTKWPYFDTYTLPEAKNLGIRSFFRDLSFEQHPRPWKGAREPKIELSGTKKIMTGWGYCGHFNGGAYI